LLSGIHASIKSINWVWQGLKPCCREELTICCPGGTHIINSDTYTLEKVQRRAAWWIVSEYSRTASITPLLSTLKISSTISMHHQSSRLTLFYKIINNLLPISIPLVTLSMNPISHKATPSESTLNTYDWPINIIELRDIDEFTYLAT